MAERFAVRVAVAVPIAMRIAVPRVRSTAPGAEAPLARAASAETGQRVGDGFGWVDVVGLHDSILHAT